MLRDTSFETNQVMVGDLIAVVIDAVMEKTNDEKMAAEIASKVLVDLLESVAPGEAERLIGVFAEQEADF